MCLSLRGKYDVIDQECGPQLMLSLGLLLSQQWVKQGGAKKSLSCSHSQCFPVLKTLGLYQQEGDVVEIQILDTGNFGAVNDFRDQIGQASSCRQLVKENPSTALERARSFRKTRNNNVLNNEDKPNFCLNRQYSIITSSRMLPSVSVSAGGLAVDFALSAGRLAVDFPFSFSFSSFGTFI